jgi:hypothetical protein
VSKTWAVRENYQLMEYPAKMFNTMPPINRDIASAELDELLAAGFAGSSQPFLSRHSA